MRIEIRHEITYLCERPAHPLLQVLRVTPCSYEGQHVEGWRIDLDCDCRLRQSDDCFGNVVDTVGADQPLRRVSIVAQGQVVTTDTAGLVRLAVERFPPAFFLRSTERTEIDAAIRDFARQAVGAIASPLDRLHALMSALHDTIAFDPQAQPAPSAAKAFVAGKGTARDLAHIFIAAAREIGAPARYVSGARVPDDPDRDDAAHAWAEAHVPGLGWIGFDPAHCLCPTENYVRIAMALSHHGAATVRSAPNFYSNETLETVLRVREAPATPSRQERSLDLQAQFQQILSQR